MGLSEFIKTNNIKGAIFDMDGTLTDSMGRWSEIYAMLIDYLKIELPQGFTMKVNHIPMRKRVGEILKLLSLDFCEEEVYSFWIEKTVEYYNKDFKTKPYMLEALKTLKEQNVVMAIATASDIRCAEAFIKSNNLTEYISIITGLEEVSRPKSYPDIYLKAAKRLSVDPSECIVFEDALTAIKAAKVGGFLVCGVQDDSSRCDEEQIKKISNFIMGF